MYECFHCLEEAVVWQADYDFEDEYGLEGQGIIHVCRCRNCGAEVIYIVPLEGGEEDEREEA